MEIEHLQDKNTDKVLELHHQNEATVRHPHDSTYRPTKGKLRSFQMKGLRKILKINTTYMNRGNTSARIFSIATQRFTEDLQAEHEIRRGNEEEPQTNQRYQPGHHRPTSKDARPHHTGTAHRVHLTNLLQARHTTIHAGKR